jgi:hypothetical protein
MLDITELSDSQLFVESDRWQCSFGYGEPVRLGLVLEAVDLVSSDEEGFSYVIDACLMRHVQLRGQEQYKHGNCRNG